MFSFSAIDTVFLGALGLVLLLCKIQIQTAHLDMDMGFYVTEIKSYFLIHQMSLTVLFCKGIEEHCGGFAVPPQLPHFD